MWRYAIVVEDAGMNVSAYVPDLPGRSATGDTYEDVGHLIRSAIEWQLRPGRRVHGTQQSRPPHEVIAGAGRSSEVSASELRSSLC